MSGYVRVLHPGVGLLNGIQQAVADYFVTTSGKIGAGSRIGSGGGEHQPGFAALGQGDAIRGGDVLFTLAGN